MTTKEELREITPEQALLRLKEGNGRFFEGRPLDRDYVREVALTSEGQNPFALVHGCIDSRAPAEMIFDQGIGDIFHSRAAGNVINSDALAGMEYACGVVGTPLILVMGHTSCGAVRGACDGVEMGNLTGLFEKIRPAIEAVRSDTDPASSRFSDLVARAHVRRVVSEVPSRSQILKDLVERGKIAVTGALYDVTSGRVDFM